VRAFFGFLSIALDFAGFWDFCFVEVLLLRVGRGLVVLILVCLLEFWVSCVGLIWLISCCLRFFGVF